jgi:hypothetical protein
MRRANALLAFSVVTIASLATVAAPAGGAEAVGSWRPTGSPLSPDSGPAVTLADGRVLALYTISEDEFGAGFRPGEAVVVGVRRRLASELYEPSSRTWVAGPAPPGESASTLVALPGGGALLLGETRCERKLYAPGLPRQAFESVCVPTGATYRLNGASAWASAAPLRTPRSEPAVAHLRDGHIMIAGGSGTCTGRGPELGYSCVPLSSAEVFDPATGVWSVIPPMPTISGQGSAATLSDATVLLIGGESRQDVLRFDPHAGVWTQLRPPPEALGGDLLPLPGDRAIALGWHESNASIATAPLRSRRRVIERCQASHVFSAKNGRWTAGPPLPGSPTVPVHSCEGGAVELTGGQILSRSILIDHGRCWAPTAPRAGTGGRLVALLDGSALAIDSASAETYTPSAARCSAAQLARASLFENMAPEGGAARPARLLSGGYHLVVQTARAGYVHINWYVTLQSREGTNRILLAEGGGHANGTAPVKMTVKLTPEGELQVAGSMSVEAQGSFAARGDKAADRNAGVHAGRTPQEPLSQST